MFKNKGFTLINLMASIAIIGIFATIALPIYNQYIERSKVAKEIPSIGNYKQSIASCFMKKDNLEECDEGTSGIPEGITGVDNIISLNVENGEIILVIDAQNHIVDKDSIKIHFKPSETLEPKSPAFDWFVYCNDYTPENDALYKECSGLITNNSGNEDSNNENNNPDMPDLDNDGIPDEVDIDKDGDGVNNIDDEFPEDPLYSKYVRKITYKVRSHEKQPTPELACQEHLNYLLYEDPYNIVFNQIDDIYKSTGDQEPPESGYSSKWGVCVIGSSWHFKTSPSGIFWSYDTVKE